MLTYIEHIELKRKLTNGEITLAYAKEQYWKDYEDGQRSWHTTDWKNRRKEIIKDKCEICGSLETLTLQHTSHPRKYYYIENEIANRYTKSNINSKTVFDPKIFREHILTNYNYNPIPLCPNCKSRKPNRRMRKTPEFLCTTCHYEFESPFYQSAIDLINIFYNNEDAIENCDKCFLTKNKWENHHNLKEAKYWFQREKVKEKNDELIPQEAFLLYLDEVIKYLSFEDTITACKKCASYFDLYHMELCPNCNKYYKGFEYRTCIQCLPEEKRKIALGKVEFGKQWRTMEKDLGID